MIKLKIISSSSKGNCYILSNKDTSIMLDCGSRKIINEDIKNIAGVLLSHSHLDHIGLVPKIKDYYNYKFYGNKSTIDILPVIDEQKKIVESGKLFEIGSFSIIAFDLEHDVDNYGYLIKDNISGYKLVYITDTGSINYKFKDIDCFLIESNCDEDMLSYDDFKEVRLYNTHLSMQQTAKFLKDNVNHNTKHCILCHISSSEENYKKHEKYVKKELNKKQIKVIAINPKMEKSKEIILKKELNQFCFD